MQFIISDLIDRARVYVGDDHKETNGWIAPSNWLNLFNVEYRQAYSRWVRNGLVTPPTVDTDFPGPSTSLTGVLAVVGVAQDFTSYLLPLPAAQPSGGRSPFWRASGETSTGFGASWSASGTGDNLTIQLDPQDATGNYKVRTVNTPAAFTDPSQTVDVPFGSDERLVLGMAKRAGAKEYGRSSVIEDLIRDADAELAFMGWGRLDKEAPRVRRNRPSATSRVTTLFPVDPRLWTYP